MDVPMPSWGFNAGQVTHGYLGIIVSKGDYGKVALTTTVRALELSSVKVLALRELKRRGGVRAYIVPIVDVVDPDPICPTCDGVEYIVPAAPGGGVRECPTCADRTSTTETRP